MINSFIQLTTSCTVAVRMTLSEDDDSGSGGTAVAARIAVEAAARAYGVELPKVPWMRQTSDAPQLSKEVAAAKKAAHERTKAFLRAIRACSRVTYEGYWGGLRLSDKPQFNPI